MSPSFFSTFWPAMALSLALSFPLGAQTPTNAPAQPATTTAPATNSPTLNTPTAAAPSGPNNTFPLVLSVLGCILGGAGLGLAGYMFQRQTSLAARLESKESQFEEKVENLVKQTELEQTVTDLLDSSQTFTHGQHKGFNLRNAVNRVAETQVERSIEKTIGPQLKNLEESSGLTARTLERFIPWVQAQVTQLKANDQEIAKEFEGVKAKLGALEIKTREEFNDFAFNLYHLLFAQSQGDPVLLKLRDQLERYNRLYENLRALSVETSVETSTQGTLVQFGEVLDKLRPQLESAHAQLQTAQNTQSVSQEKLPYLEESRKAEAVAILTEYRRNMRSQTGQLEAIGGDLSRAILDFNQPLQTLLAGATLVDVDNPERGQQHERLLERVKAIFAQAEIEIYLPNPGETLDVTKADYDFEGERHEAPFIVRRVEKMGLTVDGVVEKGEVLVA